MKNYRLQIPEKRCEICKFANQTIIYDDIDGTRVLCTIKSKIDSMWCNLVDPFGICDLYEELSR